MADLDRLSKPIRITVYDGAVVVFAKTFNDFPITFGRSPHNAVHIDSNSVSRSHCILVEEEGKLYLIDLKSSNGLTVDNKRVEKVLIEDKKVVHVSKIEVRLEVLDQDVTARTEATKTSPSDVTAPIIEAHVPRSAPQPLIEAEKPKAHEKHAASHVHHERPKAKTKKMAEPVVDRDFRGELCHIHPQLNSARHKRLEAVITWHNVVYEVKEFESRQIISVGPMGRASIPLALFSKPLLVAKVRHNSFQCYVRGDHKVFLTRNNQQLEMQELMDQRVLIKHGKGYTFTVNSDDLTTLDLGNDTKVHLRYVPRTTALSTAKLIEPDQALKQSIIASAMLHGFLALMVILMAPPAVKGPKLQNVPERYARLLVEKPKPKPTPLPPPKQEKKEIVKAPPKAPKEVVRHPPKIIKTPKVLAKRNKYPMEVKHPIAKAPPPVKVEALGALGALGAVSKSAPNNVITAININKNAGGMTSKAINMGGVVGALPSSNGTLVAAGSGHVKTKGFGYGTGTGYGTQGLRGTAGTRGVAGVVVGKPQLASFVKEEGLSRAQVMAVVKKYLGEVQHCYERNLLNNPDLAGRMEFEWDISASGKVTDVRLKRSTVNSGDQLSECVKGIFFGMRFPSASNGMITSPSIGFPFGRL